MSKNITIAEGTQAKNFNSVAKIRTNVIGGGSQLWIPEDEAGRYANLGEASIDENGTYRASDEGLDGFSKVTVNVPDSGGGHEPRLITKNITANGTYNASSDGADGYSQVIVNVPNSHGNVIIDGISDTSVSQRISTKDFWYDFDEKMWFSIESALLANTSASWTKHVERQLRQHTWLTWEHFKAMLDYDNLVIFAVGGQNGINTHLRYFIFGIADDSAYINVDNATSDNFNLTISDDTKFYSASIVGYSSYTWKSPNTGVGGWSQEEAALNAINNRVLWGTSGQANTISLTRKNADPILEGMPSTGLMTNLIL